MRLLAGWSGTEMIRAGRSNRPVLWMLCVVAAAATFAPQHARAASDQQTGGKRAANAVNVLGQRVFERLDQNHKQNVLVSPLSLGGAMAQLAEGARGETRAALLRLFGWNGDSSRSAVGSAMQTLFAAPLSTTGVTLNMANALWIDQRAHVRASFPELEKRYFGSSTEPIDFSDPSSVGVINAWVARKTQDRIKSVVSDLDPASRLLLTSAFYFQGAWDHPFDPEKTKPGRFTGTDGRFYQVPFMQCFWRMNYLERADYQAVTVHFQGWDYSIVFVLPRENAGKLSAAVMQPGSSVYDSNLYEERSVHLFLPRLKLSSRGDLLGTLKGMAKLPFGERADYGAISPDKLTVGRIARQVTLDLDEKGVAATAATMVDIVLLGERSKPLPPVTLRLDRPFYFFIRNNRTGAIVVMGRVVDPGTRAGQSSGSN